MRALLPEVREPVAGAARRAAAHGAPAAAVAPVGVGGGGGSWRLGEGAVGGGDDGAEAGDGRDVDPALHGSEVARVCVGARVSEGEEGVRVRATVRVSEEWGAERE